MSWDRAVLWERVSRDEFWRRGALERMVRPVSYSADRAYGIEFRPPFPPEPCDVYEDAPSIIDETNGFIDTWLRRCDCCGEGGVWRREELAEQVLRVLERL